MLFEENLGFQAVLQFMHILQRINSRGRPEPAEIEIIKEDIVQIRVDLGEITSHIFRTAVSFMLFFPFSSRFIITFPLVLPVTIESGNYELIIGAAGNRHKTRIVPPRSR